MTSGQEIIFYRHIPKIKFRKRNTKLIYNVYKYLKGPNDTYIHIYVCKKFKFYRNMYIKLKFININIIIINFKETYILFYHVYQTPLRHKINKYTIIDA